MNRRHFGGLVTGLAAGMVIAPHSAQAATSIFQPTRAAAKRSQISEYRLPGDGHTHEMALIGTDLLAVSLMTHSELVKVRLSESGEPVAAVGHRLGRPDSGLHGLCASAQYEGLLWCTLEYDSKLLLVDPHPSDLHRAPAVKRTIDLPPGARGPHNVIEIDAEVWLGLKGNNAVARVGADGDVTLYETDGLPVFVARHPHSNDYYVSLDQKSKIMRIDGDGDTSLIDIPAENGTTPVGLIAGPTGVWFTLAGNKTGGTGTFGRIRRDDEIDWYTTATDPDAALLHLAFDHDHALWLLSTSLLDPDSTDALIKVTFDEDFDYVEQQEHIPLPTQNCASHRVLPVRDTVLVTELKTTSLAVAANWPGLAT